MTNPKPKIDVSNMDLYYGDFHALKSIDIAFPTGR